MTARRRGEVRHKHRRRLLLLAWILCSLGLLSKAALVQVAGKARWQEMAEVQHRETVDVPAPRGSVFDREGNLLAATNVTMKVEVAPTQLIPATRDSVIGLLSTKLNLSRAKRRELADVTDEWVTIPGRFPPHVQEDLRGIRGVYVSREIERYYPHQLLARGALGSVQEGSGRGGIEQAFQQHLAGTPGKTVQARGHDGNPIPGQSDLVSPPRAGGDVVLTLDRDFQEIAREELSSAIKETGAQGGDLIVSDPKTGEILALVSIQGGNSTGLSAINAPYEPGSTLKPFTVAGILDHGVGSLSDSVDGEEGQWRIEGRTLTDTHPHERMTVAEALKVSSNIGIAKAAQELSGAQQFQILRDFGFGSRTGIEIAGENPGRLYRPGDPQWSRQSPVSLAIGYEIGVTPIQMVMAYGALANGGKLMEPHLVKELRSPDGKVLFTQEPRIVRQVIPSSLAREISQVLVDVVEDGTGREAQLANFTVAGKSGTSRAYGPGSGYAKGEYYSSFVCFLPVEDPKLVLYVKLDRPDGAYYGGATAAPVTRATMEAVLAARHAPIDREALASLTRRQPRTSPPTGAHFASVPPSPSPPVRTPRTLNSPETGAVVPDVSGLPPRLAVRRLHSRGFRVLLEASGPIAGTDPAPGTPLTPGDTVRIIVGRAQNE
jgi:cell division protein FtsI (penicillin-binding protein 3)